MKHLFLTSGFSWLPAQQPGGGGSDPGEVTDTTELALRSSISLPFPCLHLQILGCLLKEARVTHWHHGERVVSWVRFG